MLNLTFVKQMLLSVLLGSVVAFTFIIAIAATVPA